jgi:hypothetical protein
MSKSVRSDLFRCPGCLRRFLGGDSGSGDELHCPACGEKLQLMVLSLPGPPTRAASALGAELLGRVEEPQP